MPPRKRFFATLASFASIVTPLGCSGPTTPLDAATDIVPMEAAVDSSASDTPPDDVFQPAPHEPFPQLPNQGGPELLHPALVTVTFAGDTRRAEFEQYAQWIVGSNWLTTVGGEYGIGAGSVAGAVQIATAPPAAVTSADVENFLANGIQDGSIPRPTGGLADALYLVYYPSTTTITATFVNGIMAVSCTDFAAFHSEAHVHGLDFSYAVMPQCNVAPSGLTQVEFIEQAASHEIIEAATDAFPITHPAFQLLPDHGDPWFSAFRFEVEAGDLCEVPALTTREGGHVAQRSWSNAAAAAGSDPCIPADPSVPYFNTTATPDAVQHIAPGGSATFQLRGWSTGPVPDWHLVTNVMGALAANVTIDVGSLNNGRTATMRVDVPANAVAGTGAAIYLLSRQSASNYHAWAMYVTTP